MRAQVHSNENEYFFTSKTFCGCKHFLFVLISARIRPEAIVLVSIYSVDDRPVIHQFDSDAARQLAVKVQARAPTTRRIAHCISLVVRHCQTKRLGLNILETLNSAPVRDVMFKERFEYFKSLSRSSY